MTLELGGTVPFANADLAWPARSLVAGDHPDAPPNLWRDPLGRYGALLHGFDPACALSSFITAGSVSAAITWTLIRCGPEPAGQE